MPIYHKQKLIFIHVPKTAGTSIRTLLDQSFGPGERIRQEAHGTYADCHHIGYKAFCCVRDPITRARSHYDWFRTNKDYENFPHKKLANELNYNDWLLEWFIPHARAQSEFFIIDGKLPENVTILKQENLKRDLEDYFGAEIDVGKLPHIYKTPNGNPFDCEKETSSLIVLKERWLYQNDYY